MDTVLIPLLQILLTLLSLYTNVIVVAIIVSWLIMFNVLNTSNRFVYIVNDVLTRLTAPAFRLFRSLIPPLGSIDLSPLFLLLAIQFLEMVIVRLLSKI